MTPTEFRDYVVVALADVNPAQKVELLPNDQHPEKIRISCVIADEYYEYDHPVLDKYDADALVRLMRQSVVQIQRELNGEGDG